MIPWWAWTIGGVISFTVVSVTVILDRWAIRARVKARGGSVESIWGPFPTSGMDQRMDYRRYSVTFRDRAGRGVVATVDVTFWYFRLDLDP